MRIEGAWRICDDGVIRPVIEGAVRACDGTWVTATFLADCAADRTVLCGEVLDMLGLQTATSSVQLEGVGGRADSVEIATQIRLRNQVAAPIVFNGQFAAFTDPAALDMSV